MKVSHSAATQPPQQGANDSEKGGVFFRKYKGLLRLLRESVRSPWWIALFWDL